MNQTRFAQKNVVVIGASARAAAWSCYEAGLRVTAVDRFADADLLEIAECLQVDSLRRREVAQRLAAAGLGSDLTPLAVMPAGGMENQSTLWRWLQNQSQMWGPVWEAVDRVRNPVQLEGRFNGLGIRYPEIRRHGQEAPQQGDWLLKSRYSGGGIQVSHWDSEERSGVELQLGQPGDYLQRYVEGDDYSAVFVAHDNQAWLAGTTRQLCGDERLGGRGWWYCGSVGPWQLDARDRDRLAGLGSFLAREFRLQGIFGVDLRFDGKDWWLLEVNPRYPAGAEVLERSYRCSLVSRYLSATRGEWPEAIVCGGNNQAWQLVAKGIWFNGDEPLGPASEQGVRSALNSAARWDRPVADVPRPGTILSPGAPVFSVFAHPAGFKDAVDRLIAVARVWETLIFETI